LRGPINRLILRRADAKVTHLPAFFPVGKNSDRPIKNIIKILSANQINKCPKASSHKQTCAQCALATMRKCLTKK
jgi:hypothetical protein